MWILSHKRNDKYNLKYTSKKLLTTISLTDLKLKTILFFKYLENCDIYVSISNGQLTINYKNI